MTRILYSSSDLGVVDVHTVEDIFKPGQRYEVKWWLKTWGQSDRVNILNFMDLHADTYFSFVSTRA